MRSAPKPFLQLAAERRSTPAFDGTPVPEEDLQAILSAGLQAPSSYNLQPWRFFVVRSAEGRKRLRIACFNQGKVEEAPVVIVACGDADGWRNGDMEEMLRLGREGGMPESYLEQVRSNVPTYLRDHPNLSAWLNRQVMLAFTTMMWAAESLGYHTAPMEGFDSARVRSSLKLPLSYEPVALLVIGHAQGKAKTNGGRFPRVRTVFEEEYPRPLPSSIPE
ncbi:nitroreductase family protein [Acidipila sp. EB88]|uniref:nitroreductase family protein n=1 Tax=Acidipila sp. EB88 TaxID=2305226 RepID=UPI000F5E0F3D|nr:nitroreductase family protein [Acidipila sp. EB88]RRA49700.1 nitroreductase family protein [Acidipila sp. EB88]